MDIDFLVKLVPGFISWIESIFPRELQGIVIVLTAVVALVVFGWWHYRKVSVPVQYATKKYKARKSKVREVAETLGFVIEDVDRDVPEFNKGSLYTLNRKKFPRYTWAHPFAYSGRWELLCRPGEYSASVGVMGWVLNGSPPPGQKRAIDRLLANIGEPRMVFEIEYDNRMLSFYWEEKNGLEGLSELKLVLDIFRETD